MIKKLSQVALRTSLIFWFVSVVWILLSDRALFAISSNPAVFSTVSIYKGWFYVTVAALLLYATLRTQLRRWGEASEGRKSAEEALRKSEERYRSVVEYIHEVVFRTDVTGRWMFLNPAWTEVTGFEVEACLGQNFLTYVHPDDRQRTLEQFRPLLDRKKNQSRHEVRYLHKDGGFRWVEVWARLVQDEAGNAVGTAGTLTDITERKLAADKLGQSEKQFRAIVNAVPDLLFRINRGGIILDYQAQHLTDLYVPPEKFLGKNIQEVFPGHIAGPAMDAIVGAFATNGIITFNYRLEMGGRMKFYEARIIPLSNDEVLTVIRDVTDREQSAEALRDSEERYRFVVDHLNEVVFRTDAEGHWQFLNPAWTDVTGYDVKSSLGHHFLKYVHPDDRSLNLELFQPLISRKNVSYRHEIRYLHIDGGFRWLEVWARLVLDKQGKILGTAGTLTDITDRKRAEDNLKLSEERFHFMFEKHDAVMLLIEPISGKILNANAAAEKFYGYSRAELNGMSIQDITILPLNMIERERARALSEEVNFFVSPHKIASGEIRIVEVHSSPITINGESILFSIIHDITERKNAEERLRLQSAALEAAANAIVITDRHAGILWANQSFTALTGYSVEEALGKNPRDLVKSDKHDPAFYKQMWDTILGGNVWHSEVVNRRKDGSLYTEEMTITPLSDTRGEISHFIAIKQDITGRKQVEVSLRESEERFRRISSSISDIAYSCKKNDAGSYTIDWMAGAAQKITGYTIQEIKDYKCWEFMVVPDDMHLFALHVLGLKPGASAYTELRLLKKNGEIIWVGSFAECIVMDGDSEHPYLYGGLVEITERKRAEEKLKQSVSLLHATLESTVDGILVVDQAGRVSGYNNRFLQLWGIPSELIDPLDDKKLLEFVQEQLKDPEQFIRRVVDIYSNPDMDSIDVLEFKDGRVFERTSRPQRLDGKPVGTVWSFIDITEQKRAEGALRESEELYRTLVGASPDAITMTDLNGSIILISPMVREVFGFTAEDEIIGHNILEWVAQEDQSKVLENVRFAIDKGAPRDAEYQLIRQDGTPFSGEVNAAVVRSHDGKPKWFIIVTRDITSRKHAEEQLLIRNFALESSISAIGLADLSGVMTYVNESFLTLWGYDSAKEVLGRHISDFAASGERINDMVKAVRTGKNYVGEGVGRGKNGKSFDIQIATNLVTSNDGRPICIMASFVDITERKKGEEKLRSMFNDLKESEKKYRLLFEESKDVILITTPEGEILDVNQAGVELFGLPSENDLIGEKMIQFYENPADRERFVSALHNEGYVKDLELPFKRKNGEQLIVNISGSVVRDEADHIAAFRGMIRDITKQKILQQELIQAQKMESLGTLAAGIAHDFNNILGIVLGHTGLLYRVQTDPEKFQQSTQAIEKATLRGAALVRQLLTFARKTDIIFESIQLDIVIKDFVKMLAETISKSIIIETKVQQNLPPIFADATQINQVLLNLCLNARDAMPNGGKLTISARVNRGSSVKKKFPEALAYKFVEVTVSDSGQGMDDVTRQRIFEPFFTTKSPGKGTGLGLAIVFGVIESHDAFIDVQSQIGKGTTFSLHFPVEEQKPDLEGIGLTSIDESPGGSETILIVEDEETLREMVKILLTGKGYTVLTANDGAEAIKLYRKYQDQISLVVTDMDLPKMSGHQVIKSLHQVNPKVKIIIASGYLEPEIKAKSMRDGARDFLPKPYVPNELFKKIRNLIDEK